MREDIENAGMELIWVFGSGRALKTSIERVLNTRDKIAVKMAETM